MLRHTSRATEFAELCTEKYELIRFFRFFVVYFASNPWPLLVVTLLAMPLIFLNVKYTADEFMSKAIMRFQRKFKISALVGAVTLIPLSNAGPDLIVTFVSAQKDQGENIAMGSLLGAFIFVSTVAAGYVVFCSPRRSVKAPAPPLLKDIGFYAAGVVMVIFFGLLRHTQAYYAALPLLLLFLYMVTSLYMARTASTTADELAADSVDEKDRPEEAYLDMMSYTWRQLYDPAEPVFSFLFFPFKVFYMVTVPYVENPLARTHFIYAVLAVSVALSICAFGAPLKLLVVFCIALLTAALIAALCQIRKVRAQRGFILDFFSLVVSIAFMKVLTDCLLDCINFVSFVAGVEQSYLSMIVLSIGMSVSDFFSNGAISASGDDVMALMGCVSSQIFNIFVGVAGYILFNFKGRFDIFGRLDKTKNMQRGLFIILLLFAFGALALNLVHIVVNREYKRNFVFYSGAFYLSFLAISAFYAISSK